MYVMQHIEETVLEDDKSDPGKAAILRKALIVGCLVFFFSVGFFVVGVIALAKYASKTPGG